MLQTGLVTGMEAGGEYSIYGLVLSGGTLYGTGFMMKRHSMLVEMTYIPLVKCVF